MGTVSERKALQRETSEKPQKPAGKSVEELTRVLAPYFEKWQKLFPNQPMMQAFPIYLEFLGDLSPSMLEEGCKEASKRMTRFPAPGHIREAIPTRQEYAGLPALTYPPVSQEERDQAIAETRQFVRRLMVMMDKAPKKVRFNPPPQSTRSLVEQKEILRRKGFLK